MCETIEMECSRCGEIKECEFIKDTFVVEVFQGKIDCVEPEKNWWCRDCADQRRDET